MKIDIHTHTKKCKSGDALTREISPEKFCETILSSEVRIVAITNHNVFDSNQYEAITTRLGQDVQIWPGIELDILEDVSKGHLLVIVSPNLAKEFSDAVGKLTKNSTPDSFAATIDEIIRAFDALKPLYVAHYKQKKPGLSDETIKELERTGKGCVIKEVTNAISAGVYISHGHASIYGSDVHDWTNYEQLSRQLPDLRLPVDSFDHFCLLLKKDSVAINTVLNRKTSEDLVLFPFDDGSMLKIKAFNDIHVLFGDKGTGKTCILKAIAKHYSECGSDAKVYESASDRLHESFDIKGKGLAINLDGYGINYCSDEIKALRTACESDITGLGSYVAHLQARNTNRNAKKILLKEIELEEESSAKREFDDFILAAMTTAKFLEFLTGNPSVKKELDEGELSEVTRILSQLVKRLRERAWTSFSEWKEICLLNSAIKTFRKEVGRKTGNPAKPTTTGFRDYALNRIEIEVNARKIVKSIDTEIPKQTELVGSLDSNKGVLQLVTELTFQSGAINESGWASPSGVKKGSQKSFIKCLRKILKQVYADDLFKHIAELDETVDLDDIKTVYELLLLKRYFALNGRPYSPSNGEASMVMLEKELKADKEIYILDEPEKSLGNQYINDVIVPLINERARAGKKVFISTHNANIAVRTLPYSSIYRCHGEVGYSTYIGNGFLNNLVNPNDASDRLDWKKISMKTLEGGEEAFGERGIIYGND